MANKKWKDPRIIFPVKMPESLTPVSTAMLRDFFEAVALKFEAAEVKHGWNDKWRVAEAEEIQSSIAAHVIKGDPKDVAILCAIAHHHGFPTYPKEAKLKSKK